jgi:hypothetical protein
VYGRYFAIRHPVAGRSGSDSVIRQCLHYLVCPKADTYSITSSARAKNRRWKLDAERFGRAQIDQKLELGRLFHR